MKQEHEMTPGVLVSGEVLSAGDARARVAVLEAEVAELRKRIAAPAPVERCDTCYGHGEVPTGETQRFGDLHPPEPIMMACPECSGHAPVERVEQEAVAARSELLRLVELLGSVACAAFRAADDSFESFGDDGAPVISCGIDQMARLGDALDACDAEPEIDDSYARDGWLTVLDKLRVALTAPQPAPTAAHPDDRAVDRFAAAMKAKLAAAREKGRSGWDDPAVCSVDYLAQLLREHLTKGNPGTFEDVANFCMMLHQRGADPVVLAPTAAPDVAGLVTALRTVVGMLHHKATTPLERESIKIAEAAIAAHQSGGAK